MTLRSIEGIVHNGTIRLPADITLPENTQVIVVVPEQSQAVIQSPRLAQPKQAKDFRKQVIEIPTNDKL